MNNYEYVDSLDLYTMDYSDIVEVLDNLSKEECIRLVSRYENEIKKNSLGTKTTKALIESAMPELRGRYAQYYDFSNVPNVDDIDLNNVKYEDVKKILADLSVANRIKLFNRYEEEIKTNYFGSEITNFLILFMPKDMRIKYAEYYDFSNCLYEFFDCDFNDEEIFDMCKIALSKLDKAYEIPSLFRMVPYNHKREFLKLIAKREKECEDDFLIFGVNEYLEEFNIDERVDVLKNIIFKEFQSAQYEYDVHDQRYVSDMRFSPYNYLEILKSFYDEKCPDVYQSKMFECLTFLCEEYKKIPDKSLNHISIYGYMSGIVNLFYKQGYDQNKIIEYLINSGVVGSIGYELGSIVEELPHEAKKDSVEFILSMNNENRKVSEYEFFTLIGELSLDEATNYFIKYCIKEKKFNYLYIITRKIGYSCFEYLNILFSNLPIEELDDAFVDIAREFNQTTDYPKYNERYNIIVSTFADKYGVNPENLSLFAKEVGYGILKYLGNEEIKKFINSDKESVEKLLDLFNEDAIKLDKSVINDVLNSLLQRQFRLEESSTYNIFSRFESLIQIGRFDIVKKLLERMLKKFDYSEILKENNFTIDDIVEQTKAGNLELLHELTNKYIAYEREVFIQNKLPGANEALQMDKIITRESYKEDMIFNKWRLISRRCAHIENVTFSEDQKYLLENQDLFKSIIQFKQDPRMHKIDIKDKKYLKVLSEILDILYDNTVTTNSYIPEHNKDLKFEFVQGKLSSEYLIEILLEANYEGVMEQLNNEENYLSLKEILKKYKIVGWQDIFLKVMEGADIEFTEGTIASLISNYDKVKAYIDKKFSLTNLIDRANCYCTTSNLFKLVFGKEDYNFLVTDPAPNKSMMVKMQRLKSCLSLIPAMYAKESFNVPTIDKNYSLKSKKNIRVVLGNATSMMNLTYGERTGACMRKGGMFNDLFEHCLTDKNGFHIRLVSPKTGKFISRVSGTRNGNTIFLNELRFSEDSEYNNKDLYEVIKMVSEDLIELSKDSTMPIDNVIITSDYALGDYTDECQNLKMSNEMKKEAFRGVPFNFINTGILLANSKKDGKIMPYIFTENVPRYDSIREDVKTFKGKGAIERVKQIRAINDILNGVLYEDINYEYDGEVPDYVISGEDYYIAYKNGDVIDTFIMDVRKENVRTQEEFNRYLNRMEVNSNEKSRKNL